MAAPRLQEPTLLASWLAELACVRAHACAREGVCKVLDFKSSGWQTAAHGTQEAGLQGLARQVMGRG